MEFLGFEIKPIKKKNENLSPSFVPPTDLDGAVEISERNSFGYNFDASYKNIKEQIELYRSMAINAECSDAIEEIINDAIVFDSDKTPVELVWDDNSKISDKIKKKILEEFQIILKLYDFNNIGDDIFRRWYVDGRIFYHIIINKGKEKDGIAELRYIDPRYIRKIRKVKKEKGKNGVEIVKGIEEYYIYNDPDSSYTTTNSAIKIPKEAIIYCSSGLKSPDDKEVISYLQSAIKPFNSLVSLEDSLVIYRIARAPERRVFYVDTGNLPKTKAEQYMKSIINKHKNKMVYDARTGTVKDNRHILSMLEDIWLPRREGSRGTEVDTLPGAQSLGDMEEVLYFVKKLYRALRIPTSRMDNESVFNLGRSAEITRAEIKFSKFIDKLRKKFSRIFRQALRTQLILKNIITENDWEEINEGIQFRYNTDSHFAELKENEILQGRLELLGVVDEYVGRYFSIEQVQKEILKRTDEEIKKINKEIEQEKDEGDLEQDAGSGDFNVPDFGNQGEQPPSQENL